MGGQARKHHDEEKLPLLRESSTSGGTDETTSVQKIISLTFKSTANLANLLPTGTVFIFQLLSPLLTDQGDCDTAGRCMTAVLVALCGLTCLVLTFSDSYKDSNGKVYYGFATTAGLWFIDGSVTLTAEEAASYKLKFIDFVHAVLSLLVFAAVALFDQDTVSCFYPSPSTATEEVLTAVPVALGVICSSVFVAFPTTRHGIGYPLTSS